MLNNLEQFTVESYTGSILELKSQIENITGVEEARIYGENTEVKDRKLSFDISYDSYAIDRYSICQKIEEFSGVSGEVFCS